MKIILATALVLTSLLFSFSDIEEETSFNIEVKRNGDMVLMKCNGACKWNNLSFKLKDKNSMVVNELGVYEKAAYKNEPGGSFSFYVNDSPNGLKFGSMALNGVN